MKNKNIERSISNVKATMAVEGYEVSPLAEDIMRRFLNGEISSEEAIAEIRQYIDGKKVAE